MRLVRAAIALLATSIGVFGFAGTILAQPQIPATFYGTVTVDGATPPVSTSVRAFVNGIDCTQPGQQTSFILDDGVGYYLVSVMHDSQSPGCGKEGEAVTFAVNGQTAGQSAPWAAGPHELNLNAGGGAPIPLPTATAGLVPAGASGTAQTAPSASAAPSAGGTVSPSPAATGTASSAASRSSTPVSSRGGPPAPGDGPPWPAILFLVALVVALAALLGGWWLRRKR